MKRYCAREFTDDELHWIAQLIEASPHLKRAPLSRLVCQRLNWVRADGSLKDMTCRVAMLRMQADGAITLPPSQLRQQRRRASFPASPATDAQAPTCVPVHELAALMMQPIDARHAHSRLWNEASHTPRRAIDENYSVVTMYACLHCVLNGTSKKIAPMYPSMASHSKRPSQSFETTEPC